MRPLLTLPAAGQAKIQSWCSSRMTGPANIFAASIDGFSPLAGLHCFWGWSWQSPFPAGDRPLETLVAGTRALGQGDFDYELRVDGAAEVRELALAFDRMRVELKRTHRELLESDRLATIGRMASSVSHDLRHHLSAIYANAEFMSLPHTGPEERAELHLEVQEAVQSMTDLIESLLLFSQTGQMLHLRREQVDALIERTIESVRPHPECREIQISAEIPGPVDAGIDSKKLARAI